MYRNKSKFMLIIDKINHILGESIFTGDIDHTPVKKTKLPRKKLNNFGYIRNNSSKNKNNTKKN
jgi:hypothetical protein